MKRLLLPLLAALALPTAVDAQFKSKEEKDRFCNLRYDSIEKPYFKRMWRIECGYNPEVHKTNNNSKEPILKTSENKITGGLELGEIIAWCNSKASKGIMNYGNCMSMYAPDFAPKTLDKAPKTLDKTTYKGKTYTASRICPEGKKMYWLTVGGFLKKNKVEEMGCMTQDENEAFWRDYKLGRSTRSTGGGSGSSDKFFIEQKIHSQQMLNNYNRSLDNYRNNMGY